MTTLDDDSELECRVCRGGPEIPLRPLFSPCLCSGSIGLVHQDCLEAWLEHSRKDTCELCKQKYTFDPEYAENAPEIIPIGILLYSGLKKLFVEIIPFIFRISLAIFLWLSIAPLLTSWMYKLWFRSDSFDTAFVANLIAKLLIPESKPEAIKVLLGMFFRDSTTGLVLMGVIAISFIVLVST
jgi:E3 ubiquitin-protein ligase DOA10